MYYVGSPSDSYDPTHLHKIFRYSLLCVLYCFSANSLCSFDNPFIYAIIHLYCGRKTVMSSNVV